LKEKYGEPFSVLSNQFSWTDRNYQRILLRCGYGNNPELSVEYSLNTEVADEILLKEQAKSSDPSGL